MEHITWQEALQEGLHIFKPRLKKNRYSDAVGNTSREKAIWVLLKLNWTEKQIAAAIGVSQQYVSSKRKEFGL